MKREDKFGRRIYSNALWQKLLSTGQKLTELGYKESRSKPNLFFMKNECGVFFADLRGTEIVPIWDDPRPLFYWNFSDDMPAWRCRRLIKEELIRLGSNDCKARLSFEAYKDRVFEETSVFIAEDELIFNWSEGHCRNCGKDFQAEGEFCSKECEKEYEEKLKATCPVCGKKIDLLKEVKHHTRYSPEEMIFVHAGCHGKIHKSNLYPHLKPNDYLVNKRMKRKPQNELRYMVDKGTIKCLKCKSEFTSESDFERHWNALHVRGQKKP